jgi:endonuclease YncB( thermonuclease family)
MRALMLFLLLACTFNTTHAEEFSGKVIAVLDGDTVLVLRGAQQVKVRLANIDAPEKAQEYGMASKQSLVEMVLRKQVQVSSQAVDQYGRMVAHLSVDGLNVNEEQVRRGMAWEYSNFHSNQALIALQEEARQAPRGLWAQGNPTPPWDWRKQHPSTVAEQPHAVVSATTTRATATSLDHSCGNKKHCSEMSSCEEAKYYLTQGGVKTLDGDGDGVPCEKLCKSH